MIVLLNNFLSQHISDLLQNYPAISAKKDENASSSDVEETIKQILQHDQSAGAILCQLNAFNSMNASNLLRTEDILGTVATLGKVDDDNLSRFHFMLYLNIFKHSVWY